MIDCRRLTRLLIPLLILAACSQSIAAQYTKQLAPGVTLLQDIRSDANPPLVINAVSVDLSAQEVEIKAAIGEDRINTTSANKGREFISTMTARKGALIGANADYFPFTGDPLGACIVDGELISEPAGNRVAFGLLSNRTGFFDIPRLDGKLTLSRGISRQVDGINRPRETNQVIAYTPTYGATTLNKYKGTDVILSCSEMPVRLGKPITLTVREVLTDAVNTAIPEDGMVISAGGPAAWFLKSNLKPGDTVTLTFNFKSAGNYDWSDVQQSVSGGPWLVKDGQVFVDAEAQGFGASFSNTLHPRTALGLTADGKLLIVTVDGRQTISGGISLPNLAKLMIQLGAVNAINLDGGGSTTLAAHGILLNSPSGGVERAIANALLVMANREKLDQLPKLAISGIDGRAISGEGTQLFLTWGDDAQMLTQDQLSNVIWGTTDGIGFINQQGYFTPIKARKGTVSALYNGQLVKLDVEVIPGAPAKLALEVAPDKPDAPASTIKVTSTDVNANPTPNTPLVLEVTGGTAESATGSTNAKGEFTTNITWNPAAKERAVKVKAGEKVSVQKVISAAGK